jgi:ectoine hydroxylase-related dioxygenase (phytanoyl-CoA dioxygenase family)
MAPVVDYDAVSRDGCTVVRGMFSPALCARLRACVDSVVGDGPIEVSTAPQLRSGDEVQRGHLTSSTQLGDIERALATRTPLVDSENWRHTVRQPIFDSALADATIAGNMLEMQRRLLKAGRGLRLMQQMLVRTDADPTAVAAGRSEPTGWHMDTAFLPKHYSTAPQTNLYHVLTALNDVPSGGGAFGIVPAAFAQSKAFTEAHLDELSALKDSDFRTVLRPRLLTEAVQDTSQSIEVLLGEGDSCVFDLMTTHSASTNCLAGYSRYVLFQTFFDTSASYALLPIRGASALPEKFPAEFRDALPREFHYLLEWGHPEQDEGSHAKDFWGASLEALADRAAGKPLVERPAAFGRARHKL